MLEIQCARKVWQCSVDSSLNPPINEWHTSPSSLIVGSSRSSFTISARFDAQRNLSVEIQFREIPPTTNIMEAHIFLLGSCGESTSAEQFLQDSGIFTLGRSFQPSECMQTISFTFDEFQTSSYPLPFKMLIEHISCTIVWYGTTTHQHSQPSVYDMKPYLKNLDFSDVTLVAEDQELPAHKIVLASQSPVFAAMFVVPMRESLENKVELPDIDVDTLTVILEYLYTGECTNIKDSGVLWKALNMAQMYQMDEVKRVCERQFMKALTIDDVTNMVNTIDDNSKMVYEVILKNQFIISRKAPQHPVAFAELIRQVSEHGIDAEVDIGAIKIATKGWYTGQLEEFLEIDVLWKIFAFAKKYDMKEGKNFCEQKLLDSINPENVVDMLKKADEHQLMEVFWRAVELASRRPEILQCDDFKELCRLKPDVGLEFPGNRWSQR